ncbi:hypothetical protein R3I94_018369 [Phoxinus phoxinus]
MKCELKNKLLLLTFMLYLILNVESTHEEVSGGTSEENITVKFTFKESFVNSFPYLYKNDIKKEICKQTYCSKRFVLSDVENNSVTLHITNLSLEDAGLYNLVVLASGETSFIASNKIYITVKLSNKTTENILTTPHEGVVTDPPKLESSEQKSFIIFISASLIICICIFVGILCWFYRTYLRKPDAENPAVQNNRTTQQQGQCGRSSAVVVSCVEYGELDFQNRPESNDRVKPAEAISKAQDGVEYAAIIFPQQKQTPSGRMRNKQQVPAIKR